ncbi:MAG: hypothetical protein L0Y38_02530, partial [Methylococcaceae bacterium]|nr:hypothetical protein [Methylococcaceae bacterium]
VLRPHFFHQALVGRVDNTPSLRELAGLITRENIPAFYEAQGIDFNGLDNAALRCLRYLKQHGAASKATLSQALGLPNRRISRPRRPMNGYDSIFRQNCVLNLKTGTWNTVSDPNAEKLTTG